MQKRLTEVQRAEQELGAELKNREETIHVIERKLQTAEDILQQKEREIHNLTENNSNLRKDYQSRNQQLQQEVRGKYFIK